MIERAEKTARVDNPQSIMAHLNELRWRVLKAGVAILVGGIVAFIFADQLRDILEAPYHEAVPGNQLQALKVAEEWGVLMRISLFGGIIIASPVVLYQIWAFVNPALTGRERRWAVPIVSALVVLFVGGVLFAYTVLPLGLDFLLGVFDDVRNDLLIGEYYSFVLRFLFMFGLAFLYPVFLFAAAAAGLVTSRQLGSGRRWAIILVTVAAAVITPTGDIYNLLILAIPLYLMYEITYWLVRLVLRK